MANSHVHHVGCPLWPREHAVRLVVILEVLVDRVPVQPRLVFMAIWWMRHVEQALCPISAGAVGARASCHAGRCHNSLLTSRALSTFVCPHTRMKPDAHLRREGQHLGVLLRFQHEFRSEQSLLLVLRNVRPVHDVGDELRPKGQHHLVTIDIPDLLLVDDKQVIATRLSGDVDVLAQLHITFGP